MKIRPWYLGNTTVRNPFRLREGLRALVSSPLLGNLKGRPNENAFAQLLDLSGVVKKTRISSDSSDLGRKWRSALDKMGFIVPDLSRNENLDQKWIGGAFTITDAGSALLHADTLPAIQECFLRSLASYYIPSILEKNYQYNVFSPLRYVLEILISLERLTGNSRLEFQEMAFFVQLTSSDQLKNTLCEIIEFRNNKALAKNKKSFSNEIRRRIADQNGYKATTLTDYADTNIRYLKATGLVHASGRGITLVPEKRFLTEQMIADRALPASDRDYLESHCSGAKLPTDNKIIAEQFLNDLASQLRNRGILSVPTVMKGSSIQDINQLRYKAEELLMQHNEEAYAHLQSEQWEEISEYMELIEGRKSLKRTSVSRASIPESEYPAYLEWVLWRAFLALNNLTNQPYESRRFKVDQDFLPIGTAPGNGPDLIFEFDNFVIVVEVTLTENSRQEAAEGEPVRRHVANLVEKFIGKKDVYGLFIAKKIDSNTAETFRIGTWFDRDDVRLKLCIIPMTLTQFREFFMALFKSEQANILKVRELLDCCDHIRQFNEAPAWKAKISETVVERVSALIK